MPAERRAEGARQGYRGNCREAVKGSEIKGHDNYGRLPESATGRSGGTVASLASAVPRRNFEEPLTDSAVRDPMAQTPLDLAGS